MKPQDPTIYDKLGSSTRLQQLHMNPCNSFISLMDFILFIWLLCTTALSITLKRTALVNFQTVQLGRPLHFLCIHIAIIFYLQVQWFQYNDLIHVSGPFISVNHKLPHKSIIAWPKNISFFFLVFIGRLICLTHLQL